MTIVTLSHPCDRDIACMDAGTYDLSGTKIMTVHPEHKKHLKRCFKLSVNLPIIYIKTQQHPHYDKRFARHHNHLT